MSQAFPTPAPGADKQPLIRPFTPEVAFDLIKHAERRFEQLKGDRSEEFDHWREISEWISPRRGQWIITERKDRSKLHGRIINNVADRAADIASAGMQSGLTSRSRPWFQLSSGSGGRIQDPAAKAWLREVEEILRDIFDRSNFYETTRINYQELYHWGIGAYSILPDSANVIHCRQHTVGGYYLGIDDRGRPDTFAGEFVLTADQAASRYVFDRLSEPMQMALKNGKLGATMKVRRIVEPNLGKYYKPGVPGWRGR